MFLIKQTDIMHHPTDICEQNFSAAEQGQFIFAKFMVKNLHRSQLSTQEG
jgi:hypothetical protein